MLLLVGVISFVYFGSHFSHPGNAAATPPSQPVVEELATALVESVAQPCKTSPAAPAKQQGQCSAKVLTLTAVPSTFGLSPEDEALSYGGQVFSARIYSPDPPPPRFA
ncbi:hypothetical protein [Cohaesibacter haloalkalitolerans]|uniref:hypothetical protein n=1 Tax=Cohaesibacter haloalkalitolerans TaxID=1162980 RepID=UPI0013C3F3EE|nr:hypothetical protein [Cohaesibacter haloalkalitolerans]